MFEWLYSSLDSPGFFRLFGFVSFRALMAGLVSIGFSFLFGEVIIRKLRTLNFKEVVRGDGPQTHLAKQGTPTMGGLMILFGLAMSGFLFGNFSNLHFSLIYFCTLAFGAIGFMDDYSKVVLKKKGGMSAKVKMVLTLVVALSFCLLYYNFTPAPSTGPVEITGPAGKVSKPVIQYVVTGLFVPFVKGQLLNLTVFIALPFWMIVIVGSTHAVNLTDGLDGLAIGTVSIVTVTLGLIAYITGSINWAVYLNLPAVAGAHELTVFLAALTGAGMGFLWFNAPPAKIFMGDTGSLALGGALGMTVIVLKKEVLLVILGGIFVMEALSVILQVASYKLRGKRIFKMAPIHHHYEESGWPETRIVIRFWLIGAILSLMALATLRLQ